MNITLISIAIEKSNLSYPLGALCIESAIKSDNELKNKTNVKTLLFDLEDDPIFVAHQVVKTNTNLVGLSIYLWNREWIDIFTKTLLKLNKDILIFGGGSEVSANPYSFDLEKYIFLIAGEGEESTLVAIKQLVNNEKLIGEGIMSQDNPVFSYSPNIELNSLTSPLLSGISDPFLSEGCSILWEMTRGCPFKCGFCFESKGLRSVRNYSFERIEKELDYIVEKGVVDIFVLDPTFNIDKKRTIKILNLIRDKAPHIHFTFEVRAELLDKEIVQSFSEIFCSLQIGLQSIHKHVLKTINRNFKLELFKEKINLLNRMNLVYGLDLIIGLPNDNIELFKESLDFTVYCKPSNIDIFLLSLLPGTKLHDEAEKYNLNYNKNSPYTLIESPTFSKEDISLALKIQKGCEYFYTKGGASPFMKVICDALHLRPSQLFLKFTNFLENNYSSQEVDELDIFTLQDIFIKRLIDKYSAQKFEKALVSYIELNQGLSYFVDYGQSPLLSLWYEPNDLSKLETIPILEYINTSKPYKTPKEFIIIGEVGSINIVEYK